MMVRNMLEPIEIPPLWISKIQNKSGDMSTGCGDGTEDKCNFFWKTTALWQSQSMISSTTFSSPHRLLHTPAAYSLVKLSLSSGSRRHDVVFFHRRHPLQRFVLPWKKTSARQRQRRRRRSLNLDLVFLYFLFCFYSYFTCEAIRRTSRVSASPVCGSNVHWINEI